MEAEDILAVFIIILSIMICLKVFVYDAINIPIKEYTIVVQEK